MYIHDERQQSRLFLKMVIATVDFVDCSQTEIDDMIRKLANVLLTRTLGGCLSTLIKRPTLNLLQVSYLLYNCVKICGRIFILLLLI